MSTSNTTTKILDKSWMKIVQDYNYPNAYRSWWQIVNSFVPYFGLWVLMYYSLSVSYWLTLLLSIFAAGFLARIFVIFHDSGHGSTFRSPFLNRMVGLITGGLIYTSYHKWHHGHRIHHRIACNLDEDCVGDIKTYTVNEYKNLTRSQQIRYRIYRHPLTLFVYGPLILFIILNRFPSKTQSSKEKLYTHLTSLGIALGVFLVSMWIGFIPFLLIQLPILFITAAHGSWLLYVQHQFEDVHREYAEKWDYGTMALAGSSYLKLPVVLKWFTGNIGFHHIHHLSPLIPNYKLEKCYNDNPAFQVEKPLTFFSALSTLKLRLWDEERNQMIGFKDLK